MSATHRSVLRRTVCPSECNTNCYWARCTAQITVSTITHIVLTSFLRHTSITGHERINVQTTIYGKQNRSSLHVRVCPFWSWRHHFKLPSHYNRFNLFNILDARLCTSPLLIPTIRIRKFVFLVGKVSATQKYDTPTAHSSTTKWSAMCSRVLIFISGRSRRPPSYTCAPQNRLPFCVSCGVFKAVTSYSLATRARECCRASPLTHWEHHTNHKIHNCIQTISFSGFASANVTRWFFRGT